MSIEQTKGYFRVKGKIWGLNNKEPFTNPSGSIRTLSIGIQTSKDNSNFIQVGQWTNTKLNVKYKTLDMEETEEINEQDAIDKIKETFKDGDSVYVNLRMDVNTYSKRLDFLVSNIYSEKEAIDFEADDFEEICELKTPIVITEKPSDRIVKGGLTDYKGDMVEVEFKLDDDVVNDYFMENAKVGDLIPVTVYVYNKPKYEGEGNSSERKTLKGKKVTSGGKHITGRELEYQIVDVDVEKTEKKKYKREDIRAALEQSDNQGNNSNSTNNTTKNYDAKKVDDDDLPF